MHTRKQKGFTLFEMSMVLIIIGLVVGGILAGKALIKSSQVRAQLGQVTSYNEAINTFRLKYNAVPGDIKAARATELGLVARAGGPGCGNGNGVIEGVAAAGDIQTDCSTAGTPTGGSVGNEWFFLWADLSNAGLAGVGYDNASMTTTGSQVSTNLREGKFLPLMKLGDGYGYVAIGGGGADKPMSYYFLNFIGNVVTGEPTNTIPAEDAFVYDSKVDDGNPASGSVLAIDPNNAANLNASIPASNTLMARACQRPGSVEAFLRSLVVSPAYADVDEYGCDAAQCQYWDGNTCFSNCMYGCNGAGSCCPDTSGCSYGTYTDGNGCGQCASWCDSTQCQQSDGNGGCTSTCGVGESCNMGTCCPDTGSCPCGTEWNGTCNVCISNCCPDTSSCPCGTYWDGSCNQCNSNCCSDPGYCSYGTYTDGSGCTQCASYCDSNQCQTSDGNGGCTSTCAGGDSCNMGTCCPDTNSCPCGTEWNGTCNVCSGCPPTDTPYCTYPYTSGTCDSDPTGCYDATCPGGGTWNSTYCTCESSCPYSTGVCNSDPSGCYDTSCMGGGSWDSNSCSCQTGCMYSTGVCNSDPSGCYDTSCMGGGSWDSNSCSCQTGCMYSTSVCDSDPSGCYDTSCSGGGTWSSSSCSCITDTPTPSDTPAPTPDPAQQCTSGGAYVIDGVGHCSLKQVVGSSI